MQIFGIGGSEREYFGVWLMNEIKIILRAATFV